jgi:hypothetical protein
MEEKALLKGFVDVFIKLKHLQGSSAYFLIKAKQKKNFEQLESYVKKV